MDYLDFNEIDHSLNISSANTQTTATTTSTSTTTTSVNQQAKDLSDWRNIQLGTTPTMFDRFWIPTTVNPWPTSNPPIYPSLYNQQASSTYPWMNLNTNPTWPTTTLPMNNFSSPQPNLVNEVIDLTTNHTVNPSTTIRYVYEESEFPTEGILVRLEISNLY